MAKAPNNIAAQGSSSNQDNAIGNVQPNPVESSAPTPRMAISKASVESLERFVSGIVTACNSDSDRRTRYEYVDRLLQRELDRTETAIKSKLAYYNGNSGKIPDIELPLAFMQFDTAHAWLASIFSTGYPIFSAMTTPDLSTQGSQMNALVAQDQRHFGWMREINKAMAAALRYNECAMEVSWDTQLLNTARNFVPAGDQEDDVETFNASNTSTRDTIVHSGNSLRAMDMYNTFWDTTCNVNEVHSRGAFAGYVERLNYIQLKQYVSGLNSMYIIGTALKDVFKASTGTVASQYYTPFIDPFHRKTNDSITGANVNWDVFFGMDSKNKIESKSTGYEKVVTYARIIPVEFGIRVPKHGAPQVWKLVTINGMLLYAEPIVAGHNYLPMIFAQVYDYDIGNQSKSFVEGVAPFQHLGTAIIKGMTAAMRKNVADRIFYNPAVFNKSDIDSTAPDARVPVKLNRYVQNFDAAFRQVDFRDTLTPNFNQNLNTVLGLANQAYGVNQAQQGNFVKGNKTMEEFQTIMSKADGRLQLLAMNLESSLFYPIKQIIKLNYLLFATDALLLDPVSNTMVNISPSQLRQRAPDFSIADGLIPIQKMGSTQALIVTLQMSGQIPELAMNYDMAAIAVEALKQMGFSQLDRFKRTPEQKQEYLQQLQAQTQAQNPQQPQPTGQQQQPQQ